MAVMFKPNGTLNVAQSPGKLKDIDMQRCKNLRLDRNGRIETRDGNSKLYETALSGNSDFIITGIDGLYIITTEGVYLNGELIFPFGKYIVQENQGYILQENGGYIYWE